MHPPRQDSRPDRKGAGLLKKSSLIWFLTAAVGQIGFVYYILVYYGGRTVRGDYEAWNDRPIIEGYTAGDPLGNVMFALHVLLAAVVTFGGLIQLIPFLRRKLPGLHRWNGRIFMTISVFLAVNGIWLVWVRGSRLNDLSAVPTTINGVLILIFAVLAYRLARARKIDQHRQWAMRLFMAVNGVWFFRVGIMAWLIINQGPVGMNNMLSGPADLFLSFGSYLIPLIGLEIYFAAGRSRTQLPKTLAAIFVLLMAGIMAIGIFGTIVMMWGPYL